MFLPNSGYHPPQLTNLTSACSATGGSVITFSCNKQVSGTELTVVLTDDATGLDVWSGGFDANKNADDFTIRGTANGSYTLTADNGENTKTASVQVFCTAPPVALSLDSLSHTDATTSGGTGTISVQASGGTAPLVATIAALSRSQQLTIGQPYVFTAVAIGGPYALTVTDAKGQQVSGSQTISGPAVATCTDPEADNYGQAGACAYTPRVQVSNLPELAPLGVPFPVMLASAPIKNAVPALATATVNLTALAGVAGVQVRVDGYLFTSGPLIVPGRFLDAASLLEALTAQPALAASYTFALSGTSSVRVTARAPGLPGTPTVSSSSAVAAAVTTTPGAAALHSQRRYRWGVYVEVWAGCGSVYGGPTDKAPAVLAQRLTADYRADNAYVFDLAPALRQFTGHGYPSTATGLCPDRLISYFLRFGEEYADTATGLRRVRTTYESNVAWGLEAMALPPVAGADGLRRLSTRPWPYHVAPGQPVPMLLLALANPDMRTLVRYRLATARTQTDVLLTRPVAAGQVVRGGTTLAVPAGALEGVLYVADTAGVAANMLASFVFDATGQPVSFVNRLGGLETVYFAGNVEDGDKRTPASFTTTVGPQLLSAEMSLTNKLWSGPLGFDEWDWLRQELGVSPAVWLETPAGPVSVQLTDLTTDSDRIKGEYSLAFTYSPAPVRGLSN